MHFGAFAKDRGAHRWDELPLHVDAFIAAWPDNHAAGHTANARRKICNYVRENAPLTRFGIYKIVRCRTAKLSAAACRGGRRISPHVFRHTTAVQLLEAGVEVNVVRAWLGHVSLDTTNRYAEINLKMKEAALRLCEPPVGASPAEFPRRAVWRDDTSLLAWLESL